MNNKELLKITEWATGTDTGLSSRSLCRFMLGIPADNWGYEAPYDADDRGRCIRLLNLIPEWWDRLDELTKLPSKESNLLSAKGIEIVQRGWKEQIPLIRKEGKR